MKVKGVFLAIMLLAAVVDAVPSLVLTSEPPSSEPFCPGPVLFSCNATDITVVFYWELNDATISEYTFNSMDRYPLDLTFASPLIESIQVINATLDGNSNSLDIISTLRVSDVSILNGLSLHCEDFLGRESNNISVVSLATPPVPTPNCSLLLSSGGPEVILQWSDMFNRDHVVYKYHVSMSPSLPSCPNTLEVGPDQDYTCSGLEIGQQYNISFTAFNCINQQGETAAYSFQLGAPDPPIGVSLVNGDSLQWMEVVTPSFSVNCSTFNSSVSYLVIIQDNNGEMITNKTVLPTSCESGVCSTTIPSSDRNCRVTVRASNLFGNSDNADFAIIGSVKYTSSNIGLLVAGLIVWCLAFGIWVVTLVLIFKGYLDSSNKPLLYFSVSFGVFLVFVSLFVWVATGAYVEQQEDTCDPSWQSVRNGLIIAAFVISFFTLSVVTLSLLIINRVKLSKLLGSFLKGEKRVDVIAHSHPNSPVLDQNPNGNGASQDGNNLSKPSPSPGSHPPIEGTPSTNETHMYDKFRDVGDGYGPAVNKVMINVEMENAMQSCSCPCYSILRYNQYLKQQGLQKPEWLAAWFQEYRRWPKEKLSRTRKLQVYFMSKCPVEWKYKGEQITPDTIMRILQGSWANCFSISKFKTQSDIRVDFQDLNWSAIGQYAKLMESECTMSLSLAGLSDEMIEPVIIHQFGHALGLGHALMDPKDWATLKKHVDVEKMMESLGVLTSEDLEVMWTGKGLSEVELSETTLQINDCSVLRDPSSVMQYSTSLLWLKNEAHRDLKEVMSLDSNKLKKVLTIYHKHINFYKCYPSAADKKSLHMLIEGTTFTCILSNYVATNCMPKYPKIYLTMVSNYNYESAWEDTFV